MKRHFQSPPPEVVHLSVEEEAILADTQSEATIGLDAAVDEVDRIGDVATIANDAVQVVDETPELGTVEQNLVSAVADMAVAGTDAAPEEVLAMAPLTDGDGLTTEGIMATLKTIWDAIVTSIKNMWVGIKHWFTTYFSTLEQNKKHAEALIAKLGNMKGKVAGSGDVSISDVFGYSGYSGFKALFSGVERQDEGLRATVIACAENQTGLMLPIGEGLIEAFNGMQVVAPTDGATAAVNTTSVGPVVDALATNMAKYCEKLGMKQKGDGFENDAHDGNVKIFAKHFSPNHLREGNDQLTKIANLGRVRFGAWQNDGNSERIMSMKPDVTPEMLVEHVKKRLVFIELLLKMKTDHFTPLEQMSDKVDKACEAMLARLKQDDPKAVSIGKKFMPLATAYANWATQPAVKLFSIAARHNKWWLSLYEKAANNYNDAPVA